MKEDVEAVSTPKALVVIIYAMLLLLLESFFPRKAAPAPEFSSVACIDDGSDGNKQLQDETKKNRQKRTKNSTHANSGIIDRVQYEMKVKN